MKKQIRKPNRPIICMAALMLMIGACHKDQITDLPEGETQFKEVVFSVSGFESVVHPLFMELLSDQNHSFKLQSSAGAGNVSASENEQTLYFWSFNQENTVPDIGIDLEGAGNLFSGNHDAAKVSYVGGKAFSPYPAGRSYSVNGPKEIRFKMPIRGVTKLGKIYFDIGSSNTGPKDFIFSYSLDHEQAFTVLSEDNQFDNTTSTGWNRYEYDLSFLSLPPDVSMLWIKMEFKIGDRGYGSDYNETSGTVRIDNFGLTGVYINDHQSGSPPSGGTVHYHIFHKQDSTLAVSGEQLFSGGKEAVPEIKVQLAEGQYFGSFIVCFSEQELLVPASVPEAPNFYVRNSFDNSEAVIYGTLLEELTVERDMQRELIFERLYSEIVFQFVDEAHLGAVRSIQITEVQPVYYMPFYKGSAHPGYGGMAGSKTLTIAPDWTSENPNIRFHQFLGLRVQPLRVEYEVQVIGHDQELLREFLVQATIFHNTKLIFSGKLLQDSEENEAGFPIVWNEDWREIKSLEF